MVFSPRTRGCSALRIQNDHAVFRFPRVRGDVPCPGIMVIRWEYFSRSHNKQYGSLFSRWGNGVRLVVGRTLSSVSH